MKQLFFLAVMLVFIACNDNSKYSKLPEQQVKEFEPFEFVVTEFMDAGGYTYAKGTLEDQEIWIAIPQTDLENGAKVYYNGGMVMQNFESKQLNRTFEEILFLEEVFPSKEAALKKLKEEEAAAKVKNPHANAAQDTVKQERPPLPNIELPEDVISIEDIFTKQKDFEGKSVTVYGVVWKVNNGILDRNWVHIEDGTSTADKSSLTITTLETVKIGDTVKMKGNLTLNKDFGYGYVYDVLLEEGTLLK